MNTAATANATILLLLINAGSLVLTAGCDTSSPPHETSGYLVEQTCPNSKDRSYYFPAGALFPLDRAFDEGLRQYLSELLAASGMPSLSCGGDGRLTMRMISIGHPSDIIVEVTQNGRSGFVKWVQFSSGRRQPTAARHGEMPITATRLEDVRAALARANFWTTRSGPRRLPTGGEGHAFVVEVVDGPRYRVVHLTPEIDEPFASVAQAFFDAAGILMRDYLIRTGRFH